MVDAERSGSCGDSHAGLLFASLQIPPPLSRAMQCAHLAAGDSHKPGPRQYANPWLSILETGALIGRGRVHNGKPASLPPANRGGGDACARKVAAHLGHGGPAPGEAKNHIHASFCGRDAGSGDSRDHRTKPEHGQKPSVSCSSYGPRSDGKRWTIFGRAAPRAESDGAEPIGHIFFCSRSRKALVLSNRNRILRGQGDAGDFQSSGRNLSVFVVHR
jgi:hypothetical protein